ncbi:hypothetical protein O4H66_15450 [Comamonadaceae bacterium G21597-S1]|nr:hypothetical protein [Comamonadaceae bacterium G21597-S1]
MNMPIKPGSRWGSATCTTEIVVVRPPSTEAALECGGTAMHSPPDAARQAQSAPDAASAGGTLLGKRYTDDASGLEVLCTKPGAGSLSVSGRPMSVKAAKALPSSD